MEPAPSPLGIDRRNNIEWRLYRGMLVTRLFEEACIRWEHEGKMSAQVFPSRGQEAIAVGAVPGDGKRGHGDSFVSYARRHGGHGHHHRGAAARDHAQPAGGRRFARCAASQLVARAGRDARFDDDRRPSGDGRGTGVGDAARRDRAP